MAWTEHDEQSLQRALKHPRNAQMLRVLVHQYNYERDDVLQEIRLACMQLFPEKTQYARSTIIGRATTFILLHLCRHEGRRRAVFG